MVVSGSDNNGHPETAGFVMSQAESLRNAGREVLFGVVDDRTSIKGIVRNWRRLRKEVAKSGCGLVHAQYGSVTAAIARLIKGNRPLIVSFCGDDLLGTPLPGLAWRVREKVAKALGIWAASKAKVTIVKSANLYQVLPARLRKRTIILPNGVDTDWFRPMELLECRRALGWKAESRVVLFNASRNEDQSRKNPALAQRAIELVSDRLPDVSLWMVSKSPRREMALMMNAADCLLVTSLHEGSPNIVKEAMACNLPVVSVQCGDVAERLSMTVPGAVCPYDAKELAAAIVAVLESGQRSNGREQILSQGLDVGRVAHRLIDIYGQCQAGGQVVTDCKQD